MGGKSTTKHSAARVIPRLPCPFAVPVIRPPGKITGVDWAELNGRRQQSCGSTAWQAKIGLGKATFVLIGLWILMICAALPFGAFPLNDDWRYSHSVKSLFAEHRLLITQWDSNASLTNTAFGWLFCLPFGFSFAALRASSQVLGCFCAISIFFVLRRLSAPWWLALMGALALMLDPLFFQLSNTFMTKVGAAACLTAALVVMLSPGQASGRASFFSCALLCLLCLAVCLSR